MTATEYLHQIANQPCTTEVLVAQGILWAAASCRVDGTTVMALRQADCAAAQSLLDMAAAADCSVMADVPRWMIANKAAVLEVLSV